MAKGFIAGMTDYSHQSFDDIVNDLENELKFVIKVIKIIEKNKKKLRLNGYWDNNVIYDFKSIIAYSLTNFKTTVNELEDIIKDIKIEVKEHHCKRLDQIARVAHKININIGKIWNVRYDVRDYDNENFMTVEYIYTDTRDMAVDLLDISNIASRLTDFIGKSNKSMIKNNNPWISGSFYLFVAIIVIVGLTVLLNYVHWIIFPFIVIAGILLLGIIGAFQLKNDNKIKDETFIKLIIETYKRLPLLRKKIK